MRECTSEKKKKAHCAQKKKWEKKKAHCARKKNWTKKKKKHIAREKKLKKATRANISLINQKEAIHACARHKN